MPDYLAPPDLSGESAKKPDEIEDYAFDSSNIASARYDGAKGEAIITMARDGSQYLATGVSKELWSDFKLSGSPGKFFHANLKDLVAGKV
jgi:hypothetical protein